MVDNVKRPAQSGYYTRILGNMKVCATAWCVDAEDIRLFLGQSRCHTGLRNNYQLFDPASGQVARYLGSHKPDRRPGKVYAKRNLRGPYTRQEVLQWQKACPDYNQTNVHRPPSPAPTRSPQGGTPTAPC